MTSFFFWYVLQQLITRGERDGWIDRLMDVGDGVGGTGRGERMQEGHSARSEIEREKRKTEEKKGRKKEGK